MIGGNYRTPILNKGIDFMLMSIITLVMSLNKSERHPFGSLSLSTLDEQEIQKVHGDKYRQEIPIEKELVRRVRLGPSECFFHELPQSMVNKYFQQTSS